MEAPIREGGAYQVQQPHDAQAAQHRDTGVGSEEPIEANPAGEVLGAEGLVAHSEGSAAGSGADPGVEQHGRHEEAVLRLEPLARVTFAGRDRDLPQEAVEGVQSQEDRPCACILLLEALPSECSQVP